MIQNSQFIFTNKDMMEIA